LSGVDEINSIFLNELCDLLEVPRPDPAGPDDEKNAYVFERAVPFPNPDGTTTVQRIDFYKRDCFVLKAKQGSNKVAEREPFALSAPKRIRRGTGVRGEAGPGAAMYEAKGQAELYVRNLPASEHNLPFIAVVLRCLRAPWVVSEPILAPPRQVTGFEDVPRAAPNSCS
jgi:hypothetical protein